MFVNKLMEFVFGCCLIRVNLRNSTRFQVHSFLNQITFLNENEWIKCSLWLINEICRVYRMVFESSLSSSDACVIIWYLFIDWCNLLGFLVSGGNISVELIRRSENRRRPIDSSSFYRLWSSSSHQIWIAIVIGYLLKLRSR